MGEFRPVSGPRAVECTAVGDDLVDMGNSTVVVRTRRDEGLYEPVARTWSGDSCQEHVLNTVVLDSWEGEEQRRLWDGEGYSQHPWKTRRTGNCIGVPAGCSSRSCSLVRGGPASLLES